MFQRLQDSFYRYIKQNSEFAFAVESSWVGFKDRHLVNIAKWSKRDWRASLALLAARFPNEFAPRTAISLSQKGEVKIILDSSGYTPPIDMSHSDKK